MWDHFSLLQTFAYISASRFMFCKASETFCEDEHGDIKYEDSTQGNATRYCHSKNADTGFTVTFAFTRRKIFRNRKNKKEIDSTKSRLQQIKEGNYGRRARPKLNEGSTYVIVTQELIDILTPACDKREQEERETRKGLVKKFSSLFSNFTSHTRRFKSVIKCKYKRSMRFSYATSRSSYSNDL